MNVMNYPVRVALAMALCLGVLAAPAYGATLLVLEHAGPNGKPVSTPILTTPGVTPSPERGKPQGTWSVRPGTTIAGARPSARVVEFHSAPPGSAASLVCRVIVRYFPSKSGWVPMYQLQEEPVVAFDGKGWRPIMVGKGMPAVIVQTGSALPNAEGFFSTIDFGLGTGPVSIDLWAVQ